MKLIKFVCFITTCVLMLQGCEKQYLADDGYTPEIPEIDAKEIKTIHFFESSSNFNFSNHTIESIEKLLKNTKNDGIENIGFMLISNRSISLESQKEVKKTIYHLMYKHGFLHSRIIDSGICVYKDAKIGIRIHVLKYDVKAPDCNKWSEYIGDIDTNKHLPKYGAANLSNTVEMIANEADLVSPRKYRGQETSSAISAISGATSSSEGTSSSSSSDTGSQK